MLGINYISKLQGKRTLKEDILKIHVQDMHTSLFFLTIFRTENSKEQSKNLLMETWVKYGAQKLVLTWLAAKWSQLDTIYIYKNYAKGFNF